jgi:hypothetical protein
MRQPIKWDSFIAVCSGNPSSAKFKGEWHKRWHSAGKTFAPGSPSLEADTFRLGTDHRPANGRKKQVGDSLTQWIIIFFIQTSLDQILPSFEL